MTTKDNTVTLMAVGDIMLSENRGTGKAINRHGPEYPFLKIREYLQQADILFGNLESPISNNGTPYQKQDPHMTFRSNPISVRGLSYCGFGVLSLANNHTHDFGNDAFFNTLSILNENEIKYVGAGIDALTARRPVMIDSCGIKVAFIAYSCFLNPATRIAKKKQGGIAHFRIKDAIINIQNIRTKADVIIVSMHWGLDFLEYPIPFQMQYAREMIDNGAHLIIGHHPHCLQGVEKYKNGIIVYSLGDFIFDEPDQDTCILKCAISKQGIYDFEIIPAVITNNFQTEIAVEDRAEYITSKILSLSKKYECMNSDISNDILNRYIYINLYVFKLSWNLDVLKNLGSSFIIRRIFHHLFKKVIKFIFPILKI